MQCNTPSGPHFALQVDWRFSRRWGAIVHLQLHALDGLGHMSLMSGQSDSMGSRILAGDTINTFL